MIALLLPGAWYRRVSRPYGILLMTAICLSQESGQGAAQEAALTAGGVHFAVRCLESGGKAFQNRDYVWERIPPQFEGWHFTQTKGGLTGAVVLKVERQGIVHVATSDGALLEANGWQRDGDLALTYSDEAHSALPVYRKPFPAGDRVSIPQTGWAGTIVFAPAMSGKSPDDHFDVPGVVIRHSPSLSRRYIGCPSIAVLPSGDYVASHSYFGKGSADNRTAVYRSADGGNTWEALTELVGQWWSSLFVHDGRLYILGTSGRPDFNIVIRRSADGGRTWTVPLDRTTGLLADDARYHTAPVPVVVHKGRLWRGMEMMRDGFRALVLSAPVDADLLRADRWTLSDSLASSEWLRATEPGFQTAKWLEGNVVITPDNGLINVLRINHLGGDRAAMLHVSEDGRTVSFDPDKGLIVLPGAANKFTIRRDPQTRRYWTLASIMTVSPDILPPYRQRNVLALLSSPDVRTWTIESEVLSYSRGCRMRERVDNKIGFQYVDWQFDGEDIIAVSRTAWGDEVPRSHDANFLTFHRLRGFRRGAQRAP
ncbi:sialidase family protein [Verrucomicrobiota bacterium]